MSQHQIHEHTLRVLHEHTRALMDADARQDVAEVAADAVRALLNPLAAAVFLWDEQEGCLRVVAKSDDGVLAAPEQPSDEESSVWTAFVSGETRLATGLESPANGGSSPSRSELAVSTGAHGVLLADGARADSFDDSDVAVAELLASNVEAALDRTEREAALGSQEDRLQDRDREVTQLTRVNRLLRAIQRRVVRADSRLDVQEAVCECLTDDELVAFAWVGHRRSASDELQVDAWSGDGRSFLDHVLAERQDEQPLPRQVIEAQAPVTVDSIARDAAFEAWREPALNRGFRSVTCLPLSWRGHEYGFLEIYGSREGAFEETTGVLPELTTHVANALNAVERMEALVSGQTTELELDVEDADDPLFELARRTESRLSVEGVMPGSGGSWLVHLVLRGDPATLVDECDRFVSIEDARVVRSEGDRHVVSLTVSEFALVEVLGAHGATIRAIELTPTGGTVTVTAATSTDIRTLVRSCERALGDVALVRCERADETGSVRSLRYDLDNVVTEKQLAALRVAFSSGYFEVPRAHTGTEVAQKLDVSGTTFQHHVRKGIRRILSAVFEAEDGDDTA